MPDNRWKSGPKPGLYLRTTRSSQRQSRFSSKVRDWVEETKERANEVFQTACRMTADQMQATVPYDEGYLKSSMVVTVNSQAPAPTRTKADGYGSWSPGAVAAALEGARVGDRVAISYTMVYARRLEYGFVGTDSLGRFYNQAPRAWVRAATMRWSQTVAEAIQQVAT